jgi:hypothetical protein
LVEESERFLSGGTCAATQACEVVVAGEDLLADVFDQRAVDADQGGGRDRRA